MIHVRRHRPRRRTTHPPQAVFATLRSPSTPADFGKFVVDETEKWGNVVRAANIKAE
jgi:hypothetical protein